MGGLARRATAIAHLREEHEHVLLVDSGETLFQGGYSAESDNPQQGALIVAAMNAMGYDALALGKRDLEAPLSTVQARFGEAGFPILSANLEGADTLPNVQPYVLHEVGGHAVALIGATSDTAGARLEALGLERPEDVVAAVVRSVKEAKRHADVILVLSNLERSQAEALAQAVPGIDAIIGVYRGLPINPVSVPGAEGEVVLHASGRQGQYLGVLTLHLDEQGQVTGYEGRPVALTDVHPDDAEIVRLLREHADTP
jgi:2',3'-cyclic-nucleotide 2'-phosphodiesterase (5'-nucleotidase family)